MTKYIKKTVKGLITTTSNKISDTISQKIPTKTIYFKVESEEDRKKLLELGLTEYTSNSDGKGFFVVKSVANLPQYKNAKEILIEHDMTIERKANVFTDEPVMLSILKVEPEEKTLNTFYRLQAILSSDENVLKETEPQSPFESDEDELPF